MTTDSSFAAAEAYRIAAHRCARQLSAAWREVLRRTTESMPQSYMFGTAAALSHNYLKALGLQRETPRAGLQVTLLATVRH